MGEISKLELRLSENGLSDSEIKTLAVYIKVKLKKKVDLEKLKSLRGEEAIKFYTKYYEKAQKIEADIERIKGDKAGKKQKAAKEETKEPVSIDKILDSEKIQNTDRKAIELWADHASEIESFSKLVKVRLNILAKHLNLDYNTALQVANSDDSYNKISERIYG